MVSRFHMMGISLNQLESSLSEEECEAFIRIIQAAYDEQKITAYTILRTCLRLECYYTASAPLILEDSRICYRGSWAAVCYLFQLACGMHSLLKGEDQVLAQIKGAHQATLDKSQGDSLLNIIFNKAISLGKKFRHISGVSRHALSLEALTLKHIKAYSSSALDLKILILGLGNLSQSIMHLLKKEGAVNISVTNRGWHKCKEIALTHGVHPVDFRHKKQALEEADIIISATSAPHYVVSPEDFQTERSRLFLDLALPRDVDPRLGDMGKLITINDIWRGKEANLALRDELIASHQYLLEEAQHTLMKRLQRA